MRLVAEELLDDVPAFHLLNHFLEDVGGEHHDRLQRLVQEVTLQPQLQTGNSLTSFTFICKLVQLPSDLEGIDVLEPDREQHLTVSEQFLQHLGVAVFEGNEELFDLLEHLLLGLRRIHPLSEMVEQLLLVHLPVFFPPQTRMNIEHALAIFLLLSRHVGHAHAVQLAQ